MKQEGEEGNSNICIKVNKKINIYSVSSCLIYIYIYTQFDLKD